jgi:hydrogenase expression/formation protein HypE
MNKKENNIPDSFNLSCPVPVSGHKNIQLAHGGGGKLMHDLIEKIFIPNFQNELLNQSHDGAVFEIKESKLAFTTDSYVIKPLFFPGGNIGELAVFGTVNDLAMCGAKPLYISCGLIIEEGLSIQTLEKIIKSMKSAADKCGVQIVTGDTKVVDKGKGDELFINTAGIGIVENNINISPGNICEGDAIVINGDIGRHGIAVMSIREGLEFETVIESDAAPLNYIVENILVSGIKVRCLRDLTRGGLASALNELSASSNMEFFIEEKNIPVREDVRAACEILGFDPLYVANEGRFIVFINPDDVENVLTIMHDDELGREAKVIGFVKGKYKGGLVGMESVIGAVRIVDMLSGEQLPRIC